MVVGDAPRTQAVDGGDFPFVMEERRENAVLGFRTLDEVEEMEQRAR